MYFVKRLLLNFVAYAVVIYLIANLDFVNISIDGGLLTYGLIAVVLGILMTIIAPILKLLVLPFSLLFNGFVTLILNILFLYSLKHIVNEIIAINGYQITFGGLGDYLVAGILFSILAGIVNWLLD